MPDSVLISLCVFILFTIASIVAGIIRHSTKVMFDGFSVTTIATIISVLLMKM